MKAYWIVRCHVFEPGEFAKYVELAGPIIKNFNGTFLTRGGAQIELEGEGYERTVLIEFCLLYTSPSPRDRQKSRMPSSA